MTIEALGDEKQILERELHALREHLKQQAFSANNFSQPLRSPHYHDESVRKPPLRLASSAG